MIRTKAMSDEILDGLDVLSLDLCLKKPMWRTPQLEKLDLVDIAGGFVNVPEVSAGAGVLGFS